jgi:hypothetical protein
MSEQYKLEQAYDEGNLKLFIKLLKKDADVKKYLQISIENYNYDFATSIIIKFNKYKTGAQQSLESGAIDVLDYCIKKIGFEGLKINKQVLQIIEFRINRDDYKFFEYLLYKTNLINKAILTKILCYMIKVDDETAKIIYYLEKTNDNVNLNDLNNCALNNGNEELVNILVKKGANQVDIEILKEKIKEKQKRLLQNKVDSWINKWTLNSDTVDKNLSPELITGLKDTVIDNNYTIYRGLTWGKDEMNKSDKIDINKLQINDKITIDLNTISSWSTNYEVAYIYSKYKVISRKNDYGLILKLNIDKSNIIADLRHKDEGDVFVYGDEDSLIVSNQSEIILAPGKYECEVMLIRILDKTFVK